MTNKLKELREICEAATKGPWKADDNAGCKRVSAKLFGNHKQAKRTELFHTVGLMDEQEDAANAALAAISRTALPAALDLIEEMAEALRQVRFHTTDTPKTTAAKAWEKYEAFVRGDW